MPYAQNGMGTNIYIYILFARTLAGKCVNGGVCLVHSGKHTQTDKRIRLNAFPLSIYRNLGNFRC